MVVKQIIDIRNGLHGILIFLDMQLNQFRQFILTATHDFFIEIFFILKEKIQCSGGHSGLGADIPKGSFVISFFQKLFLRSLDQQFSFFVIGIGFHAAPLSCLWAY